MRTDTTVNGGQPFYYHQDRNGNVTHLTSGAGAIVEQYKYDAFGAPTFYDGSGNLRPNGTFYNNRFLFTGREYAASYAGTYVPAFNFYEYRARAYNPTLGRFMSEDPIGFDAGDYNLFRYCHNDPLDLTDPMGLDTEVELRYYIMGSVPVRVYGNVVMGGGNYGHQNLVLRDTETGKMMTLRGMPSGDYNSKLRGALNLPQKDSNGKYQTLKAELIRVGDTKDPYSGRETQAVAGSKVVLKDSMDKVGSKLNDVNAAINRSNITYRPQTENSNAVAATGYNAVTDRQAPSSPQLPGSNIVFKPVYELGSNIPRLIPVEMQPTK